MKYLLFMSGKLIYLFLPKNIPYIISAVFFKSLVFFGNLKQIFKLSFHISANGDKSWILRLFRHLSYWEILGISLCFTDNFQFKSSTAVVKALIRLCRRTLHFSLCGIVGRMGVIVQRHRDVGVSHDILQRLGVHICVCYPLILGMVYVTVIFFITFSSLSNVLV